MSEFTFLPSSRFAKAIGVSLLKRTCFNVRKIQPGGGTSLSRGRDARRGGLRLYYAGMKEDVAALELPVRIAYRRPLRLRK
jgi:hypothetical protein